MKNRKLTAMLAVVMMAVLLMTGCGDKQLDAAQVAATVDGEEISLGVANFAAKLQQAQTESYYMMFFGQGMWEQEAEEGVTMEEATKDSVMSLLQELYVVRAHADDYGIALTEEENQRIAEAAAKFIEDNSETALGKFTATEDVIKEYLELITIQMKVSEEIVKDVDTVVSDEEAAQRRINYVYVNTYSYANDKNESVEYTAEEKAERVDLARAILEEAKAADDLDAAATAHGLTMASVTYGEGDTGMAEAVRTAVDVLKEGEYSDVIESEYGCYVAYVASDFDAEATEERKTEIVEERESALYLETYQKWADASEFVVNEEVWSQVNFAAPVTVITGDAVKDSDEVENYTLNEDGEVVNSEDAE